MLKIVKMSFQAKQVGRVSAGDIMTPKPGESDAYSTKA